jgi:hypothetical protein
MSTTQTVIVIVVIAIVVIALLLALAARRKKQQREHLQDRFGPEYDRAVAEHGDEKAATSKLAEVEKTREKLDIRELSPAERERYASDWKSVQAAFVDAPDAAVRDADRLVGSVMRDCGYPVDDFEVKSDMVAVDHPNIAENYRAAHSIRTRTDRGDGSYGTEDLRQAFVHYRALFVELLGDDDMAGQQRNAAQRDALQDNDGAYRSVDTGSPSSYRDSNTGTRDSTQYRDGETAPSGDRVERDVNLRSGERTTQEPPQR